MPAYTANVILPETVLVHREARGLENDGYHVETIDEAHGLLVTGDAPDEETFLRDLADCLHPRATIDDHGESGRTITTSPDLLDTIEANARASGHSIAWERP